jgi:GT2 family glycosyltransferase
VKISIIIPFLNASEHLPNCLQALEAQKAEEAEIILIDNGSSDYSAQIVRDFISNHPEVQMVLLKEETPGASAARNTGAKKARGHWLVFTDADCIVDQRWLQDLEKHMHENSNIAGLAGSIRAFPSESIVSKFLGLYTLPANKEETIHCQFSLVHGGFPTANMAVRRDVFTEIGGFNNKIPFGGEDHDLCAKIYRAGYCIKTLTCAIVQHNHRSDIKGLIKQSYGFGKSHALSLCNFALGAIILQAPMIHIQRIRPGSRIWIEGNQADKKLLGAVAVAALWRPLWVLPFAYYLYLCLSVIRQGKQAAIPIRIIESPAYAALLLLKSASMTVGRLVGSLRYRVLCI